MAAGLSHATQSWLSFAVRAIRGPLCGTDWLWHPGQRRGRSAVSMGSPCRGGVARTATALPEMPPNRPLLGEAGPARSLRDAEHTRSARMRTAGWWSCSGQVVGSERCRQQLSEPESLAQSFGPAHQNRCLGSSELANLLATAATRRAQAIAAACDGDRRHAALSRHHHGGQCRRFGATPSGKAAFSTLQPRWIVPSRVRTAAPTRNRE